MNWNSVGPIGPLTCLVSRRSPFSGFVNTVQITMDPVDYRAWQMGVPIQCALPYLQPFEREFLLTGITEDDWARNLPRPPPGAPHQVF